jgi:hypothetical protein
VAALQALDVIAIPICRHVSFWLCIIKGRENPEKAAKTFAAQTNSPIPLLRDLLAGVRLRRLISKKADGRSAKEPTVDFNIAVSSYCLGGLLPSRWECLWGSHERPSLLKPRC